MGSVFYRSLYFLKWDANRASNKSYFLILNSVDTYRASQTIYLKRLQGMVIQSGHGDRDGHTFNKRPALRSGD